MSGSCDVIDNFLIYKQFEAIWKPDFGRIVSKTYIFSNSNLYLIKAENKTKKSVTQPSHYYFHQTYYFS